MNTFPRETHANLIRGLTYMVVACLLFSIMTVSVYAVSVCEPALPAPVVSFVRVLINLAILCVPALLVWDLSGLFGDRRPSLWLRGFFGAMALMLSFASIQLIGPGESAFLGASSGVFVAFLGPFVLAQRNSAWVWLAILGALSGLLLLFEPRWGSDDRFGRAMALGSGFLAALAYLMVARSGRSNSPRTVIFYFCLVALAIHLIYFAFFGFALPTRRNVWTLLLVGGIAGSGAQFCMTQAYQMAPAALVSAVGYLSPVLSLTWGIVLFTKIPDPKALIGCALVLFCGVILPFLTARYPSNERANP